MDALNELNNAVSNVIEAAKKINDEAIGETYIKAPIIVHQRLCHELVEVMQKNSGKHAKEIPKAVEILTTIKILKTIYPQLNQL